MMRKYVKNQFIECLRYSSVVIIKTVFKSRQCLSTNLMLVLQSRSSCNETSKLFEFVRLVYTGSP